MADDNKIVITIEADDNASQKIDQISRSLRNLDKDSQTGTSSATGNLSSFISKLEDGIGKVNSATRHYNSVMSGFNRTVTRLVSEAGSAVYDFTTQSIDNFTEFSRQHAAVLGAMAADYDNTAESQRKFFEDSQKLKEQAMQIGTYGATGQGSLITTTEVSGAQEALIKAGISTDQILNTSVLNDVLTFAQANNLSTDSAVETAVTLGNQFNIPIEEWGSMLDKISHTADMSVVDVSDITQSLKWASGISAGLDRPLEEVLGMITILGDFGLKGSQAGTGIQSLLTRLLTGDTTVITDAQAEVAPGNALEKFYEFEKIAKPDGNLLPMSDVIEELNATMEGMTDEEQAWFAKKLFGLYQMKSAYALLNGEDVDLEEVIREITEQSDGTNQNKLDLLLNSQYGKLTTLGNLVEGTKTDLGERLSPFVTAVRDELFAFLSADGNYNINFDNLRTALDESCDLIEEKYGSAIANAVRGIGDLAIDFTQIGAQIAPELGKGLLEVFSSAFSGDFFGEDGAFADWGTMIDNMNLSVEGLPENLQGLGSAVVSAIDWFGKLVALNVASEIAELISSVLQILTIAGGAVINVAGAVVVNGTGAGGAGVAGVGGSATAGAASKLSGATKFGTADDVAKFVGTSTDDVLAHLGQQASYSIDDVARYMNTSTDDLIKTCGSQIDEVIASGAASVDEIVTGSGTLFGSLSKFGKILSVAGTLYQLGAGGYEAYNEFKAGDTKAGVETIGGTAGSLGGGFAGAALGTLLFPGIGTVAGAILGSIGGDKLGSEAAGNAYNNFDNAKLNYGTFAAAIPLIGEWIKKDGTISQKQIDAAKESERNTQEERYGIKPSDYGMPTIFDELYDGKTGKIPFDPIISDLQNAKDYPIAWGRKESEYGMNVDEAKSWQDSKSYNDYIEALGGAKQALIDTQKELESQMIQIKKGDKGYDEKLDKEKRGQYSVWTGTQAELDKYMKGKTFFTDPTKDSKGTIADPYILSGLATDIKNAIISGLQKSQTSDKEAITDKTTGQLNITSNSTTLTGELQIPNVSQLMPQGYAALSEKGKQDLIQNEINNNIQIDDSVTMTPSFHVSPPSVSVNVSCVGATATVKKSVLNSGQGSLLNSWYSRTSSQYGKTKP